MAKYRVVDSDGHVLEPQEMWLQYLEPRYHPFAPRAVTDTQGRIRRLEGGELSPYIPVKTGPRRESSPGGYDPRARLADMESEGIDISVLFPSIGLPLQSITRLDALVAVCQAYNNWMHDFCIVAPEKLLGVVMVPQMDIYEATVEARRGIEELGFKAVLVRPNPLGGRTLDHPAFDSLWELCVSLDVPVTVHEGTTMNIPQAGERYDNYLFRHMISHPHEQQMACLSLICGGVLERHPKLRVAFLESGAGWIAHWLERMDHHQKYWGHTSATLPMKPSEYFARQCWISTDPDEAILPGVIDVIGDDNILFASDYPHGDATWPGVVAELADRADISEESKAKIFSENPARLYALD